MRYIEIIGVAEGEITTPMTPAQTVKRAERQRRTQKKITDERSKSAAKINDLRGDLP